MFSFGIFLAFSGSWVFGQVVDYETTPRPLPPTSFTCQGLPPGYYADVDTGCRTYHVCDGNSHFTYICPRRTLFSQKTRICDHSYLVRCEESYGEDAPTEPEGPLAPSPEEVSDEGFSSSNQTESDITTIPEPAETTIQPSEPNPPVASSTLPTLPERKFLKVTLKDFRPWFFIPEINENSISPEISRELILPLDRDDLMKFKKREEVDGSVSVCPDYCNPRFFLPGSCHPCIMIK